MLVFSPAPPLRLLMGRWIQPASRAASLVGPTRFRFLNREEELCEVGWDSLTLPKLWVYNQHYFDDLNAADWRSRSEWHQILVTKWIDNNKLGRGTGWDPYPTSLRIVNWVKWTLSGGALSREAQTSLANQARWLSERIEWHLLGNHLFANAKALIFAGLYFEGREADSWRNRGVAILQQEIDEQFLKDGGQFELSTMYHALAFEDLLDLINIAGAFPGIIPEELIRKLRRKAEAANDWLAVMSHPDGRISFFNDAAFGIAPENDQLMLYAGRLGLVSPAIIEPLNYLDATGYVRFSRDPVDLFVDLAAVGPHYLPGHAHADTLSFELSLYRQRVFVNIGASSYEPGPQRIYERGTAAHNTVVVGKRDSSEVWDAFRVGRRASVTEANVTNNGDTLIAEGAHDGYVHLNGVGEHRRRFVLRRRSLLIEDTVSGAESAEASYHLHPDIEYTRTASNQVRLVLPTGNWINLVVQIGNLRIEDDKWHPEFGRVAFSSRLIITLVDGRAVLAIKWDANSHSRTHADD